MSEYQNPKGYITGTFIGTILIDSAQSVQIQRPREKPTNKSLHLEFKTTDDLKNHEDDKHVNPCLYCSLKFKTTYEVDKHEEKRHPIKICQYPNCAYTYRSDNGLLRHAQKTHQTQCITTGISHSVLNCQHCSFKSITQNDIDCHIETNHYFCKLCKNM